MKPADDIWELKVSSATRQRRKFSHSAVHNDQLVSGNEVVQGEDQLIYVCHSKYLFRRARETRKTEKEAKVCYRSEFLSRFDKGTNAVVSGSLLPGVEFSALITPGILDFLSYCFLTLN
mmetsp:Transcript_60730/g.69394  ORF Transcript_60730/g.69394 Transcript_60730/m.69394 type:complete len:119 (+) Transcript_60730:304-660(+)|eukprot:CAMPEP_0114997850 /NCGR_PEP_ID=MMETSP0216-20121206/15144_1 /TAXON_ID=223996 /ORGANISM="Protocruzia adherens, Strain Boccale" /LENGTH=118 /DNA_ID=CAMNT_0002362309 /DNA_START=394 /DNA_END=750 /DNA_ORIENTATION=+